MNRRTLLKLSAAALTGSSVTAQSAALRVATLEDFAALWDFREFDLDAQPAFVLRVPAPRTDLARARVLRVKPDFYLLGVLRECSHNGCAVTWSAAASSDREFVCHCHGSFFRASDGELIAGFAPLPLTAVRLELRGDEVFAFRIIT